jgi:hypothetical protein
MSYPHEPKFFPTPVVSTHWAKQKSLDLEHVEMIKSAV